MTLVVYPHAPLQYYREQALKKASPKPEYRLDRDASTSMGQLYFFTVMRVSHPVHDKKWTLIFFVRIVFRNNTFVLVLCFAHRLRVHALMGL